MYVMNVTVLLVHMKDLCLRTMTSYSVQFVHHTWSTAKALVMRSSLSANKVQRSIMRQLVSTMLFLRSAL
jgi:hypothetical protein